jgi:hypothetical protein
MMSNDVANRRCWLLFLVVVNVFEMKIVRGSRGCCDNQSIIVIKKPNVGVVPKLFI